MKNIINVILNADSLWGRMICVIVYIFAYDYMYANFVYGLFSYMGGVDYIGMDALKTSLWIAFSIVPFLFYRGINNASSFMTLFLYLFVYIPFIHAMFVLYGVSLSFVFSYVVMMCLFFSLYFCVGERWRLLRDLDIRPAISLQVIQWIAVALTLVVLIVRWQSMTFVNVFTQTDILYDLRSKNAESVGAMAFILYIQGWLNGVFYPILLVCYLRNRQWKKTLIPLCGYFLLFMIDMQKLTFFLPFILVGFYYFLQYKQDVFSKRLHSTIMLIIAIIGVLLSFAEGNQLLFVIASIIILRTVCVTGWLTQMYIHFFQDNPYTYYSHINVVNAIFNNYPFSVPLGKAVAYGGQNANATFFLTDGIAAYGIVGVVIIGMIFLFVLHLINALSYKFKKTELLVIFLPSLSYLLNTSLFTTLLSNGMLLLLLILLSANGSVSNPIKREKK